MPAEAEARVEPPNFPFEVAGHQRESAVFGMWVFLVTEVLFFGGMFAAYMVYRFSHAQAFFEAGARQDWRMGGLNTVVLLVGGFTMALAVMAARRGDRRWLLRLLALTWVLGAAFLVIEGWEYHDKFTRHLVPGGGFHFTGSDPAASQLFFVLYFTMTGMHMFHMAIGLTLMAFFGAWTAFSTRPMAKPNCFEVLGLYWAFVDIVWLYLYPLFYLVHTP